jgi:hypothetical protein
MACGHVEHGGNRNARRRGDRCPDSSSSLAPLCSSHIHELPLHTSKDRLPRSGGSGKAVRWRTRDNSSGHLCLVLGHGPTNDHAAVEEIGAGVRHLLYSRC